MKRTIASRMPRLGAGSVAAVGVLSASVLVFPWTADPHQAPRAVLVLVAAAVALWFGESLPAGRWGRRAGVAAAVLAALILTSALVNGFSSALWGVHGRFQGLLADAAYLLVGIAAYRGFRARDTRVLSRAAAVAVAVQSLLVFGQWARGLEVTGAMGNAVLAGGWLAVGSGLLLAHALQATGRDRAVSWVALALGVVALGLLGSRGAWVGLIAAAIAAAIATTSQRGSRRAGLTALAVVPVLVVGVVLAGPAVGQKLAVTDLSRGSAASRLAIWEGALDMIADNPVLGVGPGRFLYAFPQHQSEAHARLEAAEVRPDQAHGLPLQAASEAGVAAAIAALGLFGLAMAGTWRGVRAGRREASVLFVGLAAFAGQAVFGISTVETDALAWLLGGAALALADAQERVRVHASDRAGTAVARRGRLAAVAAVALCGACVFYVTVDARNLHGDRLIADAQFGAAWAEYETCAALNPFVDVYRLDASDAARFLLASGTVPDAQPALSVLDKGLALEPSNYDLALARARTLALAHSDDVRVLEAYVYAIECYPLGLSARREAAAFALDAGSAESAASFARGVLEYKPDDAVALGILEASQ